MKMPRLPVKEKVHTCSQIIDNMCIFYVSRESIKEFLWNFWWLATKAPIHEEVSINFECKKLGIHHSQEFDYGEIVLITEDEAMVERRIRPSRYQIDADNHRIDFTITRREAHQASAALTKIDKIRNSKVPRKVQVMTSVWMEYRPELNLI